MCGAGFVLAGGKSSRMGKDKALLPFNGKTLVEHVCAVVAESAGNVTLIGSQERYGHLGIPVLPDLRPGYGPLAGIETALSAERAEWNLVVACDLPLVSATLFTQLLEVARESEADCVLPISEDGRAQPLMAVWNRSALAHVRLALDSGLRKVTEAIENMKVLHWRVHDEGSFTNVNTAEEWRAFTES